MFQMGDIYQRMLELRKQFLAPGLTVELEIRAIVPAFTALSIEFSELSILYYRSTSRPGLTIRREISSSVIETKELVKRETYNNISVVLSIEKTYNRFPDSLSYYLTRRIQRAVLHEKPYTTLTLQEGAYFLEIEYDDTTVREALQILSRYEIPYWPTQKPVDAYSTEIISKLTAEEYYISPKADGKHAIVFINHKRVCSSGIVMVFDNGAVAKIAEGGGEAHVLEGEWMGDIFLCYDIFEHNGEDVRHLPLSSRHKLAGTVIKKVSKFRMKAMICIKDYDSLKRAVCGGFDVDYATDGWILSPSKYGGVVYKSKERPTVDLQYIDGYLYLANESCSSRVFCEEPLENGKIYEFTMDMKKIRIREDKVVANYRMPVEIDPVSRIVHGIGVPSLRFHHNYIKLVLLRMMAGICTFPRTLLDVGSGFGGDYEKWISCGYNTVYAVDPQLRLRPMKKSNTSVVHLRCAVQTIPRNVSYDAISVFFVPWNAEFLPYLANAECAALILMDAPKKLSTKIASVDVHDDEINISIPHTATAEDIQEYKVDTEKIEVYMRERGYNVTEIRCPIIWGTRTEREISEMYSYYIYTKQRSIG